MTRVERLLAALGRVERLPLGVLDGHVEERQERRQDRLQAAVQGEELPGHLLPDVRGACRGRRS